MRKVVLAFLAIPLLVAASASVRGSDKTTQVVLPVPYMSFNNLYFDPTCETFWAAGLEKDFKPPISPGWPRTYRFEARESLPEAHPLEGTTLLLFEAGHPFLTHFFHLLEHLVGLWSFDAHSHHEEVRRVVLAADGKELTGWQGPNQINDHLLRALFPNAVIQTWSQFRAECSQFNQPVVLAHAVTSDRGLSFLSAACGKINKMLGEALPALDPQALNKLAEQLHLYANTTMKESACLRVTYSTRHPPRTLLPNLEKLLLTKLRAIANVHLETVDFAAISFQQQINCIGNTDLLLSVHGNGLSHVLFLRPQTAVIEILPPGTNNVDYRLLCDARHLDYYGIKADGGLVDRETAYQRIYGNVNVPIPRVDIQLIASIVEQLAAKKAAR
jgi:hypothetical protein